MRGPYFCPHCDQRSTRWWNLKTHIKRRHGELLFGRSSDSNPISPNNPFHNTVADSVENTSITQQAPLGISQYSPSQPIPSMDDQKYGPGLSRVLKIEELKRLMGKYSQYHENPDGIIRFAVYNSINGDDTILDDKLEQLRSIDKISNFEIQSKKDLGLSGSHVFNQRTPIRHDALLDQKLAQIHPL